MMTSGVAHTAYGGVGLGYLLGFEPILVAILFSVSSALGIGNFKRKGNVRSDISIALFWSLECTWDNFYWTFARISA